MNGIERQLNSLLAEGFDLPDACTALGLDVAQGSMMVKVASKEVVTIEELVENSKPEMIQVILDIARGRIPDTRPADRLKACQLIVEGKGVLPENTSNAFSERLARMKQAKDSVVNTLGYNDNQLIEA